MAAVLLAVLAGRWSAAVSRQPVRVAADIPDPDVMAAQSQYLTPVDARASSFDVLDGEPVQRDPFAQPRVYVPVAVAPPPPEAEPQWIVSAILITDARRTAVIDDALVGVGDVISGGARVTAITREGVEVVTRGNRRRVLRIEQGGS